MEAAKAALPPEEATAFTDVWGGRRCATADLITYREADGVRDGEFDHLPGGGCG